MKTMLPRLRRLHRPDDLLRREERPEGVHAPRRLEVGGAHLLDVAPHARAGVVDEHVDVPQSLPASRRTPAPPSRVAHVARVGARARQLRRDLAGEVRLPRQQRHREPFGGEPARERRAVARTHPDHRTDRLACVACFGSCRRFYHAGMPLDHYVTLGRSGLRVSPFCLGAMTFGEDLGWGTRCADSKPIIDRFLERGGNFIDTANAYTKGHSEKIIGDHLGRDPREARPPRARHQVLHQPLPRRPQRRRRQPQGHHRAVRGVAAPPADRLHRPLLDARLGRLTPIEETMRALDDLVRAGQGPLPRLLRHAGVEGRPGADRWRSSAGWAPLVALQIEYSLLERTVEGELDPDGAGARAGRDAVVAAQERRAHAASTSARTRASTSRTASVVLGALDRATHLRRRRAVDGRSRRSSARPPRASRSRGCRARPGVASTIIGARTLEQLDDNLAALDVKLAPEPWRSSTR